jgi:hypothetical protein
MFFQLKTRLKLNELIMEKKETEGTYVRSQKRGASKK